MSPITSIRALDFKTIADFRRDNGPAIRAVCTQFVTLCRRLNPALARKLLIAWWRLVHEGVSDCPAKDLTFGVEFSVPGSFPTMVTAFATERMAETWIANHKQRVAQNNLYRFMRGRPRN
ncbi:MAG: hypothetical protein WBX25_30535 [Rhodomicrobium sp.]